MIEISVTLMTVQNTPLSDFRSGEWSCFNSGRNLFQAGYEVFLELTTQVAVFWDVAPRTSPAVLCATFRRKVDGTEGSENSAKHFVIEVLK